MKIRIFHKFNKIKILYEKEFGEPLIHFIGFYCSSISVEDMLEDMIVKHCLLEHRIIEFIVSKSITYKLEKN